MTSVILNTNAKVDRETLQVGVAHINQMMTIAQLAIDLHKIRNAASHTKEIYRAALKDSGEDFDGLDPRDDSCASIIEFTKDEYKAHLAAKRKVYNAQRRLDNACVKAGV